MSEVERAVVPFRSLGFTGRVVVESTVNSDPVAIGHNLVAQDYDEERFKGFPVVTARIEYDGTGYRRYFGWVQLVTHLYAESGRSPSTSLDAHPAIDVPVSDFGYLPAFFDAPANPDHPDMRWFAETFLVRLPDRHTVSPVAGFSWGYDLAAGVPTPLPVAELTTDRWDGQLDTLHEAAPDWTFLRGYSVA